MFRHVLTSSTQSEIWSIHVVSELTQQDGWKTQDGSPEMFRFGKTKIGLPFTFQPKFSDFCGKW